MAKRRKKTEDDVRTVERKIYFYRVNVGDAQDGKPIPFDPTPVFSHITNLAFDAQGNYHVTSDGAETLCIVERNIAPQRITLANVRRSGLPQQEEAGRFSPLGIPASSGIVEPVHVVFFPDNIVGCEFNFYGPRVGRLRTYLATKGGNHCPNITFAALLRQNAAEDLNRLKVLKSFTLKIQSSYAERVSEADASLGSAFQAARDAGEAEIVEIVLRPEKRSKAAKLGDGLIDSVRKLVGLSDLREHAKVFAVSGLDGETGSRFDIDLLSDQLIAKKKVLQTDPRTRAVDSSSAFIAIEEAYAELRDQLITAPGVTQ